MIRSNNCLEALLTINEAVNDTGKETILKITSDTLNELLREDMLPSDDNSLGEKLLITKNFDVQYNANTYETFCFIKC